MFVESQKGKQRNRFLWHFSLPLTQTTHSWRILFQQEQMMVWCRDSLANPASLGQPAFSKSHQNVPELALAESVG